MSLQTTNKTVASEQCIRQALRDELAIQSEKCIECKLCRKECKFLQQYGSPKHIADNYNPASQKDLTMPFECSLCSLCAAVCPVKINPTAMFLEMRRESVARGFGDFSEHSIILNYEKRGTSKRYSYYALPDQCDTVLFPGCTLPGTRPDTVKYLFDLLQRTISNLGIVLDCCTKPSHDLGRDKHFHAMFNEMKEYLLQHKVKNVLVACPNCYRVFKQYSGSLHVKTVYEYLAETSMPETANIPATVTVHDPCGTRNDEHIHSAVRQLGGNKSLTIEEMKHHGNKTICCGEGGSVGCLNPDYAKGWGTRRKEEAGGKRILTYCAGCANFLGSVNPTSHILDLLFEPEATLAGKAKISKAPWTYLNRIRLKSHFKKKINAAASREGRSDKKNSSVHYNIKNSLKRKSIALLIMAVIAVTASAIVHKYFYFLDAYLYTYEFYWLFNVNNLKAANITMFADYFRPMGIATEALPQVILSHLIQNYYLPFTKPILVSSATSAYGAEIGTFFSLVGFLAVGVLSYGIGAFFLGDILPFLKGGNLPKSREKISTSTAISLPLLFAIPWAPISVIAIGTSFFKIPFRRVTLFMIIGFAVRLFLLIALPSLFL